MAFEATKREWCELAAFFRLLADGKLFLGTADARKGDTCWPVAMVQRSEHDGCRRYYVETDSIRIVSEKEERSVSREDFDAVATLIVQAVKNSTAVEVESPEGVEAFLDELSIFDLEARTDDRTDLSVAFWHPEAPLRGFSVRSRLSAMNPLLDGGRTANLKFEQSGVKFASPTVNKINALPASPNEVAERMQMIERLGGVLRYADVADRVFRCNLLMIDLHFPRLLAEMVRQMHQEGITRICELTALIEQINPLKIKDELIQKHGFYKYKMKQFLMALALGMRPAKIFDGTDSAIEGILLMDANGELIGYHKSERKLMEDFLFNNTRFEKGALEKDKYGFLERENGTYYFKLNAKIGLLKR